MATKEDARLLLEFAAQWNAAHLQEAKNWFFQDVVSPGIRNLDDFRRHAPEGSVNERYAYQIASTLEIAGVLVKRGLLDEDLFFDTFMVTPFWEGMAEWIQSDRDKYDEPSLAENFEWLANRSEAWSASHDIDTSGERRGRESEAPVAH